jgi:CubicO group peptidase (beta-lactamase class C family)
MTSGIAQALSLLDAWTAHSVMQQHLPGVALTVVHGDRPVWSRAYGCADVGARVPATPQTRYRIGSITKTFTALAILQLHERGKLRLDDRLRDHVANTALHAHSTGLPDVTIRELLTHSSGLQRDLPGTWYTRPSFPAQFPADLDATYPSSTEWKYSNVGYALLGEVVAAASGEPWARYVERRILAPLEMSGSEAMPHRDEPRLATGYSRPTPGAPHVPAARFDLGAASPASSIISSAEDMGRYLAFHMTGGPVLGSRSLREMHRPQWLLDDWQTAWGLGMRVRRVDGRVRVGHPGTAPGYAALMEFIPSLKLGVAVLTNADDANPAAFCDYALQLLAPIVAKSAARPAPPLAAEEAERYCGRYRSENGNLTMLVAVLDGQLTLVPPGAPNPYAARVILERTPEPHTFIMRQGGAFSTLPFGERFAFTIGAGGEVAGYVTSGARYVREPQSTQPRAPRSGIDRRRQPQADFTGIERRAGGDRRSQQQPATQH